MRLQLEKTSRFPGGKGPFFILAVALGAYLLLHVALEGGLRLCWFQTLTGINCPTCGLSRAFLALFRGEIGLALSLNPFMLLFSIGVFIQLFATVVFRRRLALEATTGERRGLLYAFLVVFLLNWAWVACFSPAA